MENGIDSRRRKFGILCLAVPGGMVILGQTVLKSSLVGLGFVVYWLLCLLFTFAAVVIALLDVRAVRRRTREETRALFEATLADREEKEDEGES